MRITRIEEMKLDVFTAIQERRSVKHFDASFVMPEEDVERLMGLAILSPTSFNIQNWRFVLIRDPERKKQLRAAAWGQAQCEEASLAIVLCANLDAHAEAPERYWRNAPHETREMLVPMIGKFYDDAPALQRDEAMRSIGIVSQTIMLAAKGMGYDSCPMVGYDTEKVAEIIALPDRHAIGMVVVVGKPVQAAYERSGQLPKEEVAFIDRFPRP